MKFKDQLKPATFLISFLFSALLFAQENTVYTLSWSDPIPYGLENAIQGKALNFEKAQYNFTENNLPFYLLEFKNRQIGSVELKNVKTEKLNPEEVELIEGVEISNEFKLTTESTISRKQTNTYVKIEPIRKNSIGEYEKLTSFELTINTETKNRLTRNKSLTFAAQSELSSGDWYKIAVVNEGVFKLTHSFLTKLGIDLSSIDPRSLKLYGYGGGMLPASNSTARPDDMQENAIFVAGEQDGSFDKNDYILFYGEDQVDWSYDTSKSMFRHRLNLYEDTTFYFIRTDGLPGKRINKTSRPSTTPVASISEYDGYQYYEKENTNLLKSGSLWLGELFDANVGYTFGFDALNTNVNEQAKVELSVFARSGVISTFDLQVNNQNFVTSVGSTNLNRYEYNFARAARSFFNFTPNSGLISMNLTYNKPQAVSKGWLNYITVNLRQKIVVNNNQLKFRDVNSIIGGGTNDYGEFFVQSSLPVKVWDLTDKYNIEEMDVLRTSNVSTFVANINSLREFIAFEKTDSTNIYRKGKVQNQNLHALPQADLLIVTHPNFLNAANRLAAVHSAEGLSVNIATPQQIYNEFSSGAQDLIAIRSFFKMFYDRANGTNSAPKYAVMLGDASYDFKDRVAGNTNFVPAFQSSNSTDPVSSHVSDDYFAFLDDNEGEWLTPSSDRMDMAIGRFPVQTSEEANTIVDKIIAYNSSSSLGDWRNKIVFVGDDGDGVVHMKQANDLSIIVDEKGKAFNNQKIYLDAYQQVSTASGARYPKVTEDLNRAVEAGALIINYTGHGGETGWTGERVLGVYEITNWTNKQNMPVFITATCEFSRFDDPLRTSGGELVVLNPNGGGIGLMTTTRLVFSQPNYFLNRTFYDKVFERDANGNPKRLGDVFLEVKNLNAYSTNSRNFSLLGDPALKLAIPKHTVETTTINGMPVGQTDTLNALELVTISGEVKDNNGNKLTSYNGFVYPTIFDKIENKQTLNNDGGGVFTYQTRERRIFKGKATVTNGDFSFSFVVPKDISYSYGTGKISYYSENQVEDANGYNDNFIIGGSNPSIVEDDQGPQMDLFMNDESFVYGGITDNNPSLLVKLSDDQGINTVGSGIGHDLVAVLDDNTENAFILNDYYEASVDDYSSGTINYPFSDLPEGKHTLRVKAWDVANNSAEKTIEFNVVKSQEVKIENLVNYPNPFTTNTEFIFQHNQAGVPMDIKLEVFTVSGKLVKSFDRVVVNDGFISRDIKWDGRDDFGDKIGKGVYVYKLKIRSSNGSTSEKFEKLVIL